MVVGKKRSPRRINLVYGYNMEIMALSLGSKQKQTVVQVNLMPNTQFLYELQLAALEIAAIVGKAEMAGDFRSFIVRSNADISALLRRSAYIGEIEGVESDYTRLSRKNRTRSFNQYITHWFYPYKGKFHPQMVRALSNIIGMREGETLLDPFSGSGTTMVEGALLGLKTVGADISPLCALIGKVKTNAVHYLPKIEKATRAEPVFVESESGEADLPRALKNPVVGFDLLARLIALSDKVRRRRDFGEQLRENRHKMLESIRLMKEGCKELNISPPPSDIRIADARSLWLSDESVDGVITSPPYSIALNYVANDAHALGFLGRDIRKCAEEFIGVRGTGAARVSLYEEDMRAVYAEIARVLKPGRMAAIVLGDATVGGARVPTVQNCEDTFRDLGFRRLHKVNKIIFGLYNVMQREDILIFQKQGRA